MAEREPSRFTLTLQVGANTSGLKDAVVRKVKADCMDLGLSHSVTPFGHIVRCYNAERTLCDLARSRSSIDIQDM
jgi:hypothetical protein